MRDSFKKKMYREIVSPSLNKTKALMYVLRFVFKIFEFVINILKKPILNFFFKNTHVVAYDLSLDPLTFDYLYFLSFSDYSRKIKKKELKIYIFLPVI